MRETLFGATDDWVVETIDDIHDDGEYLEVSFGKGLFTSQVSLVAHSDSSGRMVVLGYDGAKRLRKLLKEYMREMRREGRA